MLLQLLLAALFAPVAPSQACASCHPKETAGFTQTAMARSIRLAAREPEGKAEHSVSGTTFTIRDAASGSVQTLEQGGMTQSFPLAYVVGSGAHALGGVAQAGQHLFQSPLSFYTQRHAWDMAPGYEESKEPDFSRPVTVECLSCHADKPRPVANTLNSYQTPALDGLGIQCDRCHGPAEAHLSNPVPGSIVNPVKLAQAARDSVCEQCHLTGEVRIPNPGSNITDFRPGQTLEESYTVYVTRHEATAEKTVKVVSQAEQLALSRCARESNGRLWCGTCHNPHETPAQPAAYFRAKCLACHGATLDKAHIASDRDCIACHMARRPAKDGGHTAFTDHRISRKPEEQGGSVLTPGSGDLVAWREPAAAVRDRNLALALITVGMQNHTPDAVIRGFRTLSKLEAGSSHDAALETALGTILLTAKQPAEAVVRFQRALASRPDYAPYEVNLASALLDSGRTVEATAHLAHAVELDPLLQQAAQLLSEAYNRQGQQARANEVTDRYRTAMHYARRE